MLELVRTFLIKLPGAKERITKYNKERMWLKGSQGSEDLRKVRCPHPLVHAQVYSPSPDALVSGIILPQQGLHSEGYVCSAPRLSPHPHSHAQPFPSGVGGDLIVCEEAAAMDTAVRYQDA